MILHPTLLFTTIIYMGNGTVLKAVPALGGNPSAPSNNSTDDVVDNGADDDYRFRVGSVGSHSGGGHAAVTASMIHF